MDIFEHDFPLVIYNGEAIFFERSDKFTSSYFGGPGMFRVSGTSHGPRKLHHIATLTISDLNFDSFNFGSCVPFYYGICFDGCEMEYSFDIGEKLVLKSIDPSKSSADWPYEDYPSHLPYFPLKVASRKPVSQLEATERLQLEQISNENIYLIVPVNPYLNMSLWGPDGDLEGVEIVFDFDTKSGLVKVRNVCG